MTSVTTAMGDRALFTPECARALDFGLRPGLVHQDPKAELSTSSPQSPLGRLGEGTRAAWEHACGCRGRRWSFLCLPAPRRAAVRGAGP